MSTGAGRLGRQPVDEADAAGRGGCAGLFAVIMTLCSAYRSDPWACREHNVMITT